nr:uncharacterized protein LOC109159795 [Ipomoea batatas]
MLPTYCREDERMAKSRPPVVCREEGKLNDGRDCREDEKGAKRGRGEDSTNIQPSTSQQTPLNSTRANSTIIRIPFANLTNGNSSASCIVEPTFSQPNLEPNSLFIPEFENVTTASNSMGSIHNGNSSGSCDRRLMPEFENATTTSTSMASIHNG